MEDRCLLAADFVVDTHVDVVDPDDGLVSLREAIQLANADPDVNTIRFNLSANQTIVLSPDLGALPTITSSVTLDGTTNTGGQVVLDGNRVIGPGFHVAEGFSTIRGFHIIRFGDLGIENSGPAILIEDGGFHTIEQNVIGGLSTTSAFSNAGDGVRIVLAPHSVIRNNEILQNEGNGITITGGAVSNTVEGNVIQFNQGDGVVLNSAANTTIGGTAIAKRNFISRQVGNGIVIRGSASESNVVAGNIIGLDENLIDELGNFGSGVLIVDGAHDNTIGLPLGGFNVISGNRQHGIAITNGSDNNQIGNNVIGVDGKGTLDPLAGFIRVPNHLSGVFIENSPNNVIGGDTISARNVLSGNALHGVHIVGANATGNTVTLNFIGTDPFNVGRQRNGGHGVLIEDAPANRIGGTSAQLNFIAGNNGDGVRITGEQATGNQVQGNIIGASSTNPIANVGRAIAITDAPGNLIGGDVSETANQIASGRGILIRGSGAEGNVVVGNFIGTGSDHEIFGELAAGNLVDFGIAIENAPRNFIGASTPQSYNFIANGRTTGILLTGAGTTGNTIEGNRIGVVADDATKAPGENFQNGILIENDASNNLIGGITTDHANVIAFSRGDGIVVTSGTGNSLLGNRIFGMSRLAIDLGGDGPSPDDPLDADSGPNQQQNAPTIDRVSQEGGNTRIEGTLRSAPNTQYRIEFFSNPVFRAPAAEQFFGLANVTTNAEGIATFDRFFAGAGVVVSATATDPNGNTSELFASMLVVNSVGDESDADPDDGTADVDLATPGDQITLRSALEESARRGVASIITFNIPVVNAEAPVIRPESALPAITQQTIVDARTQPETGFVILDGEESPFAGVLIDDGDEAFSVTLAGLEITRFGTGILNFATNSELTLARIVSTINTTGLVSNGEVVIVEDSRFSHNLERGIRMESTAILTSLEGSSLEASFNGMEGILLAAGGEGRLHNVTAVSNRSHGINTRFGPLRLTGENDVSFNHGNGIVAGTSFLEVEHLIASNNGRNGVFAGSIILLFGGNRIEFSSNNEDGFHRFGDDGLNSFNTPDDGEVESIIISNNRKFGIFQSPSQGKILLDNVEIENNLSGGIVTSGTVFLGGTSNSISDNGGHGIEADRSVSVFGNTVIANNAGSGIFSRATVQIARADTVEISGNTSFGIDAEGRVDLDKVRIENNQEGGVRSEREIFIHESGNFIIDNGGHGLHALNGEVGIFGETEILNNQGHGVVTGKFVEARQANVTISGNTNLGISAGENVELGNVRIENNGEGGVRATGLVLVTGDDNVISGNFGDGLVSEADRVSVRNAKIEFNAGAGVRSSLDVFGRSVHVEGNFDLGIVAGGDIELFDSLVFGNLRPDVSFGGEVFLENSVIFATVVTNTNNDGYGSLRNAVNSAALINVIDNKIRFDMQALGTGPHVITLDSELVSRAAALEIEGPGQNLLTITTNSDSRLFNISSSTDGGETFVVLRGMTLSGGKPENGDGGAILAQNARMGLRDMRFIDNQARDGGAIALFGSEDDSGYGGGSGGGSELVIVDSEFANNEATGSGGAIWSSGPVELLRTVVRDNTAVSSGGGLFVEVFRDVQTSIEQSALVGNQATAGDGGAIALNTEGQTVFRVSTLSGNSAGSNGGAIGLLGSSSIQFTHLTVTNNTASAQGGGIFIRDGLSAEINYSIVAQNSSNISGSFDDFSNLIGGDPGLEPLADNGGGTLTHALLLDSPAGGAAIGSDLRFDQRDVNVIRSSTPDILVSPDIGAYQRQFDFGDADSEFPVFLSDDGAWHVIDSLILGTRIDAESDGQPSSDARDDDRFDLDDEDGVTLFTVASGFQARARVVSSGPGFLNAWIDFDMNGSWDEPGDHIFVNRPVVAGVNFLDFDVPEIIDETGEERELLTFARFRLSTQQNLTPRGLAPDGEVEDYRVRINGIILPEDNEFQSRVTRRIPGVFDPEVAVGYTYEVSSGPSFATLELLPGFGDDIFTLGIDDGAGGFNDVFTFTAGEEIDFELDPRLQINGGVSRFRITGIELDAGVDPENPIGFPTVLSFVADGTVTFSQTPLIDFLNNLPTANPDTGTTDDNAPLVVAAPGLLENDFDPDPENLQLTVTAVNGASAAVGATITLASGATLRVNADGSYTYDPNGAFGFLLAGQTTTDSFAYSVTDTHGGTSDGTVTITMTGVKNAPVAIEVQNGASQRSFINTVDLLFSSATGLADLLETGRVIVERFAIDTEDVSTGTGQLVGGVTLSQVANKISLNFGAGSLGGSAQTSASDGFYRILVDVDGNGTFGDDSDRAFHFHRLLGDTDGDGDVDNADLVIVSSQYGRVGNGLSGDVNGDGRINALDRLFTIRSRGRKLKPFMLDLLDD
ncbi:MAG: right-handed parallel beta-helix repeat-containing protein [Planctomycetaceae bacterium]|nr:right-handed parallel beta-helix repeat-containing protein [Planctomycetaceae bacterium]